MAQELTIKTRNKAVLRPVLQSAIRNEIKMVALGIERTQARVAAFEQQFGMESAEFERRLQSGELEETVAFTDWRMELGALRLLESQYQALQEAHVD